MTIKIVFLDRATIAPDIKLAAPKFKHDWVDYDNTSPEQVCERLAGCTVAVVNKVPLREAQLNQLPELRMIAVAATGTDIIDKDYCAQHNIVVTNIRNYATVSVPEHAVSLMLALRRNIFAYQQDVAAGEWQKSGQFCFFKHPVTDLAGSRLGIIGGGGLGQGLATLAAALGMEVVFAEHKDAPETRAGKVPFNEVLATSDVISLHCPLTPATENMIAFDELRHMRQSALLINTARGGLVNERDLVSALQQGLIAGAGFDVLTREPPADDHPFFELLGSPNFILTPHIAWASRQAMQTLADRLIDNIERFVAARPTSAAQSGEELTRRRGRAGSASIGETEANTANTAKKSTSLQHQGSGRQRERLGQFNRFSILNEMATGIAHEINQPLTGIATYAQGCRRQLESGSADIAELLGILDKISEQARQSGEFVQSLRKLAKKHGGKREQCDVNELVQATLKLLVDDGVLATVSIDVALSARTLPVVADSIQIQQALLHLLHNAIEATVEPAVNNTVIALTTTLDDEHGLARVTVTDSGRGLSVDARDKLFDPFYTTKQHNLGMGLAVCRTVISAHAGHIGFTDSPGGGTTLYFTLPLALTMNSDA